MFNMIIVINESKKLAKHISCKCKCRFNEKNGGVVINVYVNVKKVCMWKDCVWYPAICNR